MKTNLDGALLVTQSSIRIRQFVSCCHGRRIFLSKTPSTMLLIIRNLTVLSSLQC